MRLARRGWLLGLLALGCGAAVSPETREAYSRMRVEPAECAAPGPETVTPAAMRADWARLETILRRGYAGFTGAADGARGARAFAGGAAAMPAEPVSAVAWDPDRQWVQIANIEHNSPMQPDCIWFTLTIAHNHNYHHWTFILDPELVNTAGNGGWSPTTPSDPVRTLAGVALG